MNTISNTRIACTYRHKLLATVSSVALGAWVCGSAHAEDAVPSLWLNLGWNFADVRGLSEPYQPPFASPFPALDFTAPADFEKRLGYSYGAEGSIAFRPNDSNWTFSASVRFGRAHGAKHSHQEAPKDAPVHWTLLGNNRVKYATAFDFADTAASNRETHLIVDFQAGKDVGLGRLGSSSLGFGLRAVQFKSESGDTVNSVPDFHFTQKPYFGFTVLTAAHSTYAAFSNNRSEFAGIGPSLAWTASTPLVGNENDGELALDWGVDAAVLFGKQKTRGNHEESRVFRSGLQQPLHGTYGTVVYDRPLPHDRSHSVIVPNIGGFAGFSFKWTEAKLSIGYRADYFANAIDSGIDARKQTSQAFYGPFASISIGISPSDF